MQHEEIIGIARKFVALGVDTIRLTGGEPLIRKHVDVLLTELGKLNIQLKLTTNGILLDRYFSVLQEAGVQQLNISLDSLDKVKAAFMTKRDYAERIMQNIHSAVQLGFQVKLNVVLIKGVNDDELIDFLQLTRDFPLTVKFIEFMPFQGNQWDWEKGISESEILERASAHFGEIQTLENPPHSTSRNFSLLNAKGSFGIISTITNPFCSDCNRIRLTADGNMKNCLFATQETNLLSAYRSGEDIEPIILSTIQQKQFSRDGMSDQMDAQHYEQNRSMTSIGG